MPEITKTVLVGGAVDLAPAKMKAPSQISPDQLVEKLGVVFTWSDGQATYEIPMEREFFENVLLEGYREAIEQEDEEPPTVDNVVPIGAARTKPDQLMDDGA